MRRILTVLARHARAGGHRDTGVRRPPRKNGGSRRVVAPPAPPRASLLVIERRTAPIEQVAPFIDPEPTFPFVSVFARLRGCEPGRLYVAQHTVRSRTRREIDGHRRGAAASSEFGCGADGTARIAQSRYDRAGRLHPGRMRVTMEVVAFDGGPVLASASARVRIPGADAGAVTRTAATHLADGRSCDGGRPPQHRARARSTHPAAEVRGGGLMRARDVRIGRMYAFPTNPGPWFRYAVPARVMSRAPGNRVLVLLPDGVPATPTRGELPRASLVWVDAGVARLDMGGVARPCRLDARGHDRRRRAVGRRARRQRCTDARRPVGGSDPLVVAPDRRAAAPARRARARPRARSSGLSFTATAGRRRGRPPRRAAARGRRAGRGRRTAARADGCRASRSALRSRNAQ